MVWVKIEVRVGGEEEGPGSLKELQGQGQGSLVWDEVSVRAGSQEVVGESGWGGGALFRCPSLSLPPGPVLAGRVGPAAPAGDRLQAGRARPSVSGQPGPESRRPHRGQHRQEPRLSGGAISSLPAPCLPRGLMPALCTPTLETPMKQLCVPRTKGWTMLLPEPRSSPASPPAWPRVP